jgi:hypothetical protein
MICEAVDLRAELRKSEARNRELIKALERATAILKAWEGNDIVSDDTLMEMSDEVIPLCEAALKSNAEAAK